MSSTPIFKTHETYTPEGEFDYVNSRESVRRSPFPFPDDEYMYSMNLEPHVPTGEGALRAEFDIDEHYVSECRHRAQMLEDMPGVHYAALPHMLEAQWDLLEVIFEAYARDYPEHFTLTKNGNEWHWVNRLLEIDDTFTFGDPSTLPMDPMEYATRQARASSSSWRRRTTTSSSVPAWPPSAPTTRCASTWACTSTSSTAPCRSCTRWASSTAL